MEVYVKLHKIGKNVVLAICDVELLGKTLRDGKITFTVKDEFYNGGKVGVDEAMCMVENATIVNLAGKCCVERALQKGYVHVDAVLNIDGILHAQIVKL
ncbi:MAG: DUF424 family protein [Nitrososphaerota archaeon]|nr:DUF424 family protein [Nitrososphaerota archaeon]